MVVLVSASMFVLGLFTQAPDLNADGKQDLVITESVQHVDNYDIRENF